MIVAELEIYHSRPIAPTRRLALGSRNLGVEPPPGAGGLLLAGIVANFAPDVSSELREDLVDVLELLAAGVRVVQPRVRHRFQTDRVGLLRSQHHLVSDGVSLSFVFDSALGLPVQQVLGALYAAGSLPVESRRSVLDACRNSLVWGRPVDSRFIAEVMGGGEGSLIDLRAWNDPISWALEVLGLDGTADDTPSKRAVQRRFRSLLRKAHPDHGGDSPDAAARIAELTQARDVLTDV